MPTDGATARMRIWRSLKAQGCASLRDGAYLLPKSAVHLAALQALAEECVEEKGSAWVMSVLPIDSAEAAQFEALFDRRQRHVDLLAS